MSALLDANVPMYAAGAPHPAKEPSLALLRRVATGELEIVDAEVFQEVLHRYGAIGRLADGFRVFDALEQLVSAVLPIEREDVVGARHVLMEVPGLTARDAIHVAVMRRHGISEIYSYDRHFDAVEGIRRLEP